MDHLQVLQKSLYTIAPPFVGFFFFMLKAGRKWYQFLCCLWLYTNRKNNHFDPFGLRGGDFHLVAAISRNWTDATILVNTLLKMKMLCQILSVFTMMSSESFMLKGIRLAASG